MKPLGLQRKLLDRISRKQLFWAITAALLGVTGMVGAFGIYEPWQQERARLGREYKEQSSRSHLYLALGQKDVQLKKQGAAVLLEGGSSVLTREVSGLASQAGLQIESVVPESEESLGPYTRLQIRVVAISRFQDLLAFLRSLERYPSLLKVDRLEVGESETPTAASDRHRITLLISAFSRGRIPS